MNINKTKQLNWRNERTPNAVDENAKVVLSDDTYVVFNKLADKDYVNTSVSTNSATFRGTYNSLAELQEVSADNNDYGFVINHDSYQNTQYDRYKYNGTEWVFEYSLNDNNFNTAQWAAINSGMSAADKTTLGTVSDKLLYVERDDQKLRIKDNDNVNRGYIAGDANKLEIKANEALSIGSNGGNVSVNAKSSNNINLTGAKVNVAGAMSVNAPVGDGIIFLNKKITTSPTTYNYIKIANTEIGLSSENAIRLQCENLKIGSNNDIRYNDTDKKLNIDVDEVRIKDTGDNQRMLIDDTETKLRAQNGDSSISLQDSDFRVVFPNTGDIKFIASGDNTPYTTLKNLVSGLLPIVNIENYLQASKPMPIRSTPVYIPYYGGGGDDKPKQDLDIRYAVPLRYNVFDIWEGGGGSEAEWGHTFATFTVQGNDNSSTYECLVFVFIIEDGADDNSPTFQWVETINENGVDSFNADYYSTASDLNDVNSILLKTLGITPDTRVTGDLPSLSTSNKTSLVSAVNEVITNVGTLSNLTTTDKSSIVAAINELINAIKDNEQVVANALADLDARVSNLEQPQI